MISLRDIVFFFAGAEFFHTISHILLPYVVKLPMQFWGIHFTLTMNFWAIILNGVITILLFWWACSLSR